MTAALTLGAARANVELRSFFRQRDTMVFTFALPAVILVIWAAFFLVPMKKAA